MLRTRIRVQSPLAFLKRTESGISVVGSMVSKIFCMLLFFDVATRRTSCTLLPS